MAEYIVTDPQGQRYKVNAPEGATEQDVIDFARQHGVNAQRPGQSAQRPGKLDVLGNIEYDVGEGFGAIEEGYEETRQPLPGSLMAVPKMVGGVAQAAGALPNALINRPFGAAVEGIADTFMPPVPKEGPQPMDPETALDALSPQFGWRKIKGPWRTKVPMSPRPPMGRTTPFRPPADRNRMLTAGTPQPAKPTVPTREQLDQFAKSGYKVLDRYAHTDDPGELTVIVDYLRAHLENDGFREFNPNDRPVFDAIKELYDPTTGRITDIEAVRQVLDGMVRRHPEQRAAALHAIEGLDNYAASISPEMAAMSRETAQNYGAARRSERILGDVLEGDKMGAVQRAELQAGTGGSGGNVENALRQRIKDILTDERKRRGFSRDELEFMLAISEGTPGRNLLRIASKLAPQSTLYSWGTILAGFLSSHPELVATGSVIGAGQIAKMLVEGSTRRMINRVDEMTRARSPLGKTFARHPGPPQIGVNPRAGSLAGVTGFSADINSALGQTSSGQQDPALEVLGE